jgi:hypothetical protein
MIGCGWKMMGDSCLFLIYLFSPNLYRLHPLPLSGIVPGGQSTALRRRCAPCRARHVMARHKLQAQPPQCGALPAIADRPNKG